MRIKLLTGMRTNTGPTGYAAAGDVIEIKDIIAKEWVSVGSAVETTNPIETNKERASRAGREKFDAAAQQQTIITQDEEKLAADKAAQNHTVVPSLSEVMAAGYTEDAAKGIVAEAQAKADAEKTTQQENK